MKKAGIISGDILILIPTLPSFTGRIILMLVGRSKLSARSGQG
jgi:hypothetical protein